MKKFALLAVLSFSVSLALAQEPTTTWPYLYSVFGQGEIFMKNGAKITQDLDVHVGHGDLHYLDKGVVKKVILDDVLAAYIGSDKYLNINGEMMRVVAESEDGCIVAEILGDFAALNETGGAYGSSSSSSATRKLSSIDTDSQVNQPYMLLQQNKENGQMLKLVTKYFVYTSGFTAPASKNGIADALSSDKQDAWKAWLKQNKIKWKEPQSLLGVLSFICNQ